VSDALPSAQDIAPEQIEGWLREHVPGFRGRTAIARFEGGQSNPTFRLTGESGSYVLRRKPVGATLASAHAVDREFRVLRALADSGVPVPRAFALCTDESVIGSMFYVM